MVQFYIISTLTIKHSELQEQNTHQKEPIKAFTNEFEAINKTILILTKF